MSDRKTSAQRLAKEFPSKDALKTYLKEHPNADPKNHSVSKGSEAGSKQSLKGRTKEAIIGLGEKIYQAIKGELIEMKDAGIGLKKILKKPPEKLKPEEKRQLINYSVHQSMMLGLKAAIYAVVPPPPGLAVKQAISSAAFKLIDKQLGQRFSPEATAKTASTEKDFTDMIEECLNQAVDEVLSKYEETKEKKKAANVARRYMTRRVANRYSK